MGQETSSKVFKKSSNIGESIWAKLEVEETQELKQATKNIYIYIYICYFWQLSRQKTKILQSEFLRYDWTGVRQDLFQQVRWF